MSYYNNSRYPKYQHPTQKRFVLDGENTVYPYGKYSGNTLAEILKKDVDYFHWLKDNNSITGLSDVIDAMIIANSTLINSLKTERKEKLSNIETLPAFQTLEMEVTFEKNLYVYCNEEGKELFAFYKYYNHTGLIYNIIFPHYKKYNWQDHEYALPTDGINSQGKRIKGQTLKLIVETREPYVDKRGDKMVQNLIVTSF